jgi:hypothetical protein
MKRFVVRLNGIQVKVDDMVFHQVKSQSWDPFLVTLLFSFVCTRLPFFFFNRYLHSILSHLKRTDSRF